MENLKNVYMTEMSIQEMQEVEGGLFPLVIGGVVITAKAVAYAAAAITFGIGCYVGYREAAGK